MWSRLFSKRRSAPASRRPVSHRPRVQPLEDRCLLSTAGFLDTSFGSPNGYVVTSPNPSSSSVRQSLGADLAVQTDGKIVVAGQAPNSRGQQGLAVLRYNPDGTLDTTFGSGGLVITTVGKLATNGAGVALQPDGKIVVSGSEQLSTSPGSLGYDFAWVLARYNSNGTLDTTFGGGSHPTGIATYNLGSGDDETAAVKIQPWDGKIVVAGKVTQAGTGNDVAVGRFNTNGTPDTTFGNAGFVYNTVSGQLQVDYANELALQPDHKIVVAGNSGDPATNLGRFLLLRYNADGSLDTSFNGTGVVTAKPSLDPNGYANAVVLRPDGSIVAAGTVGIGQATIGRFTSSGALDATFGSGGWAYISGLTSASDILIHPNSGGAFDIAGCKKTTTTSGGVTTVTYADALARLLPDGSLDTSFGAKAGVSDYLSPYGNNNTSTGFGRMALQGDGNIVVTGNVYLSSTYPRTLVVARYFGATNPQIGSFTASPNPVASGRTTTLTASNVTDTNPNGSIAQVAFYYYDSTGAKQVLGYGTQTSPGVWTLTFTVTFAPGSYTLYAQAEDNYGLFSNPFATTLTVQ